MRANTQWLLIDRLARVTGEVLKLQLAFHRPMILSPCLLPGPTVLSDDKSTRTRDNGQIMTSL